jgi:hypothetical protein
MSAARELILALGRPITVSADPLRRGVACAGGEGGTVVAKQGLQENALLKDTPDAGCKV